MANYNSRNHNTLQQLLFQCHWWHRQRPKCTSLPCRCRDWSVSKTEKIIWKNWRKNGQKKLVTVNLDMNAHTGVKIIEWISTFRIQKHLKFKNPPINDEKTCSILNMLQPVKTANLHHNVIYGRSLLKLSTKILHFLLIWFHIGSIVKAA